MKALKAILAELVAIRKELQAIRSGLEREYEIKPYLNLCDGVRSPHLAYKAIRGTFQDNIESPRQKD